MKVEFTVFGVPQPQGSMRAFIPKGWNRPILTTDNKRLKPWRQEIAGAALAAMSESGLSKQDRTIPIGLRADFYFDRPKSLKKSVMYKLTKPDLDKVTRGLWDALTGIVFEDDSQIVQCTITKNFGETPKVDVVVWAVDLWPPAF